MSGVTAAILGHEVTTIKTKSPLAEAQGVKDEKNLVLEDKIELTNNLGGPDFWLCPINIIMV